MTDQCALEQLPRSVWQWVEGRWASTKNQDGWIAAFHVCHGAALVSIVSDDVQDDFETLRDLAWERAEECARQS